MIIKDIFMITGSEELFEETKTALERVQKFSAVKLSREKELGTDLNFKEVVDDVEHLIGLYKRLSVDALQDFPDNDLTQIKQNSLATYNNFSKILSFKTTTADAATQRNNMINDVRNSYTPAFQVLCQYISYSLHRSADFQRLNEEARATLQQIEDRAIESSKRLEKQEGDAETILLEIRKVAAEQGVTKQAEHFRTEHESHDKMAGKWQKRIIKLSFGLAAYAILSLFLHKVPWLVPGSVYDAIQLAISKFLIFSVLAYLLFLSSKNYLNHKHNSIVNKHRQNALMTHTALVEASGDEGVRDAVLLQAASCIFSPQVTGYAPSADSEASSSRSMVEIMSRPATAMMKEAVKN